MKQTITVDIHGLSHEGRGITTVEGKTTFVDGAITGEKVVCQLTKKHSRYNEAKVIEILTAAPERTTPPCAHFGICGGCNMQHIHPSAQVQLKQKTLLEQLLHFGEVTPENVLPPLTGDSLGYRRKARLGVRYVRKKERLLVGFREKHSNYLADIHSCPVLHTSVGNHLTALSELIAGLTQYEHIPQVEVAVGDTETALVFRHMTALTAKDLLKLCNFGETHQFSIYLQPNPPESIHKLWPKNTPDTLVYSLSDYQLDMHFHPLDFTQVNKEMNIAMLKQALFLLDPKTTDNILDLFCGLGNFTLPLARFAKEVIGVEGSKEMVERATSNAQLNQITNVAFYASNLANPEETACWMQKKYDKILLDPPRTGAKEIIAHFPRWAPEKIIYVSCNPATLARDAKDLVNIQGYRLTQTGIINMFPHTSHIEAMALFEK